MTKKKRKSKKSIINNLNYFKMKITGNQWIEIIRAISTAIIAVITTLCVQSCTMSLSVAKNNNNASQKTEQTSTSSIDSTKININPKK